MTRKARILIVEDQYFIAVDSEMKVTDAGFECVGLAATCDEAIKLATELRPDLILMDIRLAGRGDGVKAAISIYKDLGIRCIFTSGHADNHVRAFAEEAHPLAWVAKPYNHAQLIGAIHCALAMLDHDAMDLEPPLKSTDGTRNFV